MTLYGIFEFELEDFSERSGLSHLFLSVGIALLSFAGGAFLEIKMSISEDQIATPLQLFFMCYGAPGIALAGVIFCAFGGYFLFRVHKIVSRVKNTSRIIKSEADGDR